MKSIGIDEISYHKRQKYATLVYDLDRSVVVWVGEGKGRETIDEFFDTKLTTYQKDQITTGCCDMSAAYIGAQAAMATSRYRSAQDAKRTALVTF